MGEFLGISDRRVASLRTPIAEAMAFASNDALQPYAFDNGVNPTELVAAMIDAHALGLASAINASRRDPATPPDVLDQAIERIRSHIAVMETRGG